MNAVIWVAIGGGIGAVARHGLNALVGAILGTALPWGILGINILGSGLMGVLAAFLIAKPDDTNTLRLFIGTGVLGGFTTFSAFSMDVVNLMQRGQEGTAAVYAVASVVLSVAAVFAGLVAGRALFS